MNHKTLYFLSFIIIGVGIAGIFMQGSQQASQVERAPVTTTENSRIITIAEATRSLKIYDILESSDYKISTIKSDSGLKDPRDLSSLSSLNLNGYLVRNNIAEGSAIIPSLVEAPTSSTFVMHSLQGDELPYGYIVKADEEYLLSALAVGDKVSLYIRLTEVEKEKKSQVGYVPEGSNNIDKVMKKYALSPVLTGLNIVDMQKEKKKEEKSYLTSSDTPVGRLVLRMTEQQLAELRVVEKAGEIILFPAEGGKPNYKKIEMDEVLPQFRSIKELRGAK
jgi:hypothetical protein